MGMVKLKRVPSVEELSSLTEDLVDDYFPKGECKEMGFTEYYFNYPLRRVVSYMNRDVLIIAILKHNMKLYDIMMMVEACAACGIEGNPLGIEMAKLFNKKGRLSEKEKKRVDDLIRSLTVD